MDVVNFIIEVIISPEFKYVRAVLLILTSPLVATGTLIVIIGTICQVEMLIKRKRNKQKQATVDKNV